MRSKALKNLNAVSGELAGCRLAGDFKRVSGNVQADHGHQILQHSFAMTYKILPDQQLHHHFVIEGRCMAVSPDGNNLWILQMRHVSSAQASGQQVAPDQIRCLGQLCGCCL